MEVDSGGNVSAQVLLTYEEAGQRARHCGKTVRKWVKEGLLRAVRLDQKVFIDSRDLVAFVESRKQGGEGGANGKLGK